jgi:hypothetical protein
MITATGYSKDKWMMAEGIAVTMGKEMIMEKGGLLKFVRWFESTFDHEEGYWMHKCKNKPKNEDLLYVYVIICNRVHYRCLYGGYHAPGATGQLLPGGPDVPVEWPYLVLAGPLVKAPHKIIRPGFQGFRYTTKLF